MEQSVDLLGASTGDDETTAIDGNVTGLMWRWLAFRRIEMAVSQRPGFGSVTGFGGRGSTLSLLSGGFGSRPGWVLSGGGGLMLVEMVGGVSCGGCGDMLRLGFWVMVWAWPVLG